MTAITETWSITVNVDGVDYTFVDPHPITDLVDQLTAANSALALWQQRASETQTQIDNLKAAIVALCTNS